MPAGPPPERDNPLSSNQSFAATIVACIMPYRPTVRRRHAEKRRRLQQRLARWMDELNDPYPLPEL